jgi:hypothetical protein
MFLLGIHQNDLKSANNIYSYIIFKSTKYKRSFDFVCDFALRIYHLQTETKHKWSSLKPWSPFDLYPDPFYFADSHYFRPKSISICFDDYCFGYFDGPLLYFCNYEKNIWLLLQRYYCHSLSDK